MRLANVTYNLQEMTNFIKRWRPYQYLWKNEKSLRELLNSGLADFELSLRRHSELESKLLTEADMHIFNGCLVVSTDKLKFGLHTEIKSMIVIH